MTELDTMRRAKMYMDKLAQGIDPITDRYLPEGCGLDQVRLARCFSYVSGILGQVIDNGGNVGQRVKTKEFFLTPEQRAAVSIAPYPVRITEFVDALYQAAADPDMKKLNAVKISDWLIAQGFLFKQTGPDGKSRRIPTEEGIRLGITTKLRSSRDGEYLAVYYDSNAQRFLLDHLELFTQEKR